VSYQADAFRDAHQGSGGRPPIFRVLMVCSANQCRSPAAERLLAPLLISGRESRFELDSAGVRVETGRTIHPLTASCLTRRGIPVEGHLATPLTGGAVGRADLILAAERSHRGMIAQIGGSAPARTFTLREFARLAPSALQLGAMSPAELVAAASSLRISLRPPDPASEDVPDPIRGGSEEHEQMVATVHDAVTVIAAALLAAAHPTVDLRPTGRRASSEW
jgi:protein-tyrosine phosphatase